MNKLYSRPRGYRNSLFSGGASLALSIAAVVLVVFAGLRFFAPGALTAIAMPIWKGGASLSAAAENANVFASRASVVQERDSLAQKNADLTAQNVTLAAQVKDLTTLLGTRTAPSKGILAAVVARPPVAPYDVLVIDQGTSAGVAMGAPVSGAGGTPIGTISEVGNTSSRVALYSTRGMQTAAWAGAGRIPLTLTGKGAGAFSATVLNSAGVVVGDGIYLPSNGAFPIGTVIKIEADPSSPSVVLDVRPYTNPFSLTWVTVGHK